MKKRRVKMSMVQRSITETIFDMLKEKPLENIKIKDLTEEANVSRVSFYRNYKSKEDVLTKYFSYCMADFKTIPDFQNNFWLNIFNYLYKIKDNIKVLVDANLTRVLMQFVFDAFLDGQSEKEDIYRRACQAGSFWGIINEWFKRGMVEQPEEMTRIVEDLGVRF